MYKVLVVDDEELVRQDLIYKVGGSGFSFQWIMSANGAEEALEMMRENPPDILLTDIMMWEKSGLDLVEEAVRFQPNLVSAIICGYPEFDLAQRALKLGVVDYLIKPVSQKQVSAVLARALAEAEEKQRAGALAVTNWRMERDLATKELQAQINALLSGKAEGESEKIIGRMRPGLRYFQLLVLRLGFTEETPRSRSAIRFGAVNLMEELGESAVMAVQGQYDGEIVAICGSAALPDAAQRMEKCETLRALLERSLSLRVDAGVSCPREELSSTAYLEAKNALDLRFGKTPPGGHKGNVPQSGTLYSTESGGQRAAAFADSDMPRLRQFLEEDNPKNAVKIVRAMMESFREAGRPGIRALYVEIVGLLSRICYRKGGSVLSRLGYENISGSVLDRCETLDEVIEELVRLVETGVGQWMQSTGDTASVLLQVKRYIEQHFSDSELCTKALAQEFCISLGYLSASYKKSFGVTISKYIISRRVEYAEHLLAKTDLSVQSVSESCGFNNLSYFMRVFKAYRNVTPSQYREANRLRQ